VILAQVGWGKSDIVEAGASDGSLKGAILSPKDETPGELAAYALRLRSAFHTKGLVFTDPQFYVTTIPDARDGHLPEYPYYAPALTRTSFNPTAIRDYTERAIDFQSNLAVDRWVAPTVLFKGFRDPWSQIALSLAQTSIEVVGTKQNAKPLLISLVFDELALGDRDALDEYLDLISTLEVGGFYIVVRRNDPGYPAAYDEESLANLMYLTHVLGEKNSFEVVHGCTDFVGVALLAVGATAVSTGWYSNLRQFSLARFLPSAGGRPPRPRYSSKPLLNSLFVNPEMSQIATLGKLPLVLSGTKFDSVMSPDPMNAVWSRRTSCLHHWEVLASLDSTISGAKVPKGSNKLAAKIESLEGLLKVAQATYKELTGKGVTFEPMTGPRDVSTWLRAVTRFKSEVGL
jgi:hypothetical protein